MTDEETAEAERVASAAIALPVLVTGFDGYTTTLTAPHHTTLDGVKAIRAALDGCAGVFRIVLDAPPAES